MRLSAMLLQDVSRTAQVDRHGLQQKPVRLYKHLSLLPAALRAITFSGRGRSGGGRTSSSFRRSRLGWRFGVAINVVRRMPFVVCCVHSVARARCDYSWLLVFPIPRVGHVYVAVAVSDGVGRHEIEPHWGAIGAHHRFVLRLMRLPRLPHFGPRSKFKLGAHNGQSSQRTSLRPVQLCRLQLGDLLPCFLHTIYLAFSQLLNSK